MSSHSSKTSRSSCCDINICHTHLRQQPLQDILYNLRSRGDPCRILTHLQAERAVTFKRNSDALGWLFVRQAGQDPLLHEGIKVARTNLDAVHCATAHPARTPTPGPRIQAKIVLSCESAVSAAIRSASTILRTGCPTQQYANSTASAVIQSVSAVTKLFSCCSMSPCRITIQFCSISFKRSLKAAYSSSSSTSSPPSASGCPHPTKPAGRAARFTITSASWA